MVNTLNDLSLGCVKDFGRQIFRHGIAVKGTLGEVECTVAERRTLGVTSHAFQFYRLFLLAV